MAAARSSAGREEVFETPDLPPELEQRPFQGLLPEEQSAANPEAGGVVPTPLDADAAFEVFHGKRYETRGLPGTFVHCACFAPLFAPS